jgi:hypothetical protein
VKPGAPAPTAELDRPAAPYKTAVIDEAIARYGLRSVVDLGGCWGVNGAYTFHALNRGELDRAVIVDGQITRLTRERAATRPQLELLEAPLGTAETVERIGKVDGAIMYDILLHQVGPDWDQFLRRWSDVDTLIICNQNWLGPQTVRFADWDVEEYLRRVLHGNENRIRQWYAEHDQWNQEQGKPWRDVYNFWQWGITTKDLVGVLWDLGYRIDYLFNHGEFNPQFPEVEAITLIARKRHLPQPRTDFPTLAAPPAKPGIEADTAASALSIREAISAFAADGAALARRFAGAVRRGAHYRRRLRG